MTSGFRLLQTFYRELFHIPRPLHQWVFPLFHVKYYVVTAPLLPVPTYREAGKCRIRGVSKSGSASHAMSDSDILESALPSGACRIPVPMTLASYRLKKMVTSASLEHVATDPKLEAASRNYRLVLHPTEC